MSAIATIGMFDGVHRGHRFILSNMAEIGAQRGLEPIVVTFPRHPLNVIAPERAPRLLSSPSEKAEKIERGGARPVFLQFDETLRSTSTRDFMAMLRNNHHVEVLMLGFNNRFGHNAPKDFDGYRALGAEMGIEIVKAPEYRPEGVFPVSSSAIRELLTKAPGPENFSTAISLLEAPYTITGTVVGGRKIGRHLMYPTANILPDFSDKLLPQGVYAGRVAVDGVYHNAMVNIGYRPTIDFSDKPLLTVEAHLLDLSDDLYSRTLTLELFFYIRGEQAFASPELLREALDRDLAFTRRHMSSLPASIR